MANKKWQKGLAVTELCFQGNWNTDKDTGKWIECTLCTGWIHCLCSSITADKFDLLTSSPSILYACNNCLSSNKKLTLKASEVQCQKNEDIINCVDDKLSKLRTFEDVLGKQDQVLISYNVSATSDNHNCEIRLDGIP